MGVVDTLVEMGFRKDKAEYAISVTNNRGVEAAMEWLLAHEEDYIPPQPRPASAEMGIGGDGGGGGGAQRGPDDAEDNEENAAASSSSSSKADNAADMAKSLMCSDCNKLFKTTEEMEYHAVKSGHINFCESTQEKKPLTEEEKKAQLVLIEEKLKLKRLEREEREKADALEREKNRIKSGKEMAEARRRMEELEMKKIMEWRKREKAEEKAARDRVRAQIESDKMARQARDSSNLGGESTAVTSTTSTLPCAQETTKTSPTKTGGDKIYTQTRIQVRLLDGSTLTETFNVKEQLSAVRVFIQMKTGSDEAFGLMTTFPRRVFADDDFEKPLDILGLVPSAVLTMTKVAA